MLLCLGGQIVDNAADGLRHLAAEGDLSEPVAPRLLRMT
ncbi:hypothetical protein STRTUCAR8_09988 [Streptomyces turgidiscabies Car8]|uniref:Uncharacterized protein n=1 Tax=Streptomyces turgidiscabies (strain Car8) TaxID=698760 RepID=L7F9S0_STRT8|nr:hypothetical protein STRTUCAR8_09988 [Streptomyces turgidiscabies Car8]